jgi:hypothetical protein
MARLMAPLLLVLGLLSWGSAGAEGRPTVSVHDGRLSVSARGATVMQVLVELARTAGIRIELESSLHDRAGRETTVADFDGLTIEEGLRRLLRDQNLAFVYTGNVLTEARIYRDGTGAFRDIGSMDRRKPPQRLTDAHGGPITLGPPDNKRPDVTRSRRTITSERAKLLARLEGTGDDEALLKAALETLEGGHDPEALEAALDALNGIEEVPTDPLMRFAATTPDPELAAQALQLLAEHGEGVAAVTTFLAQLARTSPHETIREEARSLLVELRRPPAPPPLERVTPRRPAAPPH